MHWTSLRSRCKVTPSKAGATCASQWKMWLIKVVSAICLTTVCAAQDDGEDVTIVDRTPSAPTPVPPFVPPVPSLQLQSGWLEVFPSEKVEFRCSVTGSSDWTFTWSRDGKDVQNPDPNASLNTDGSVLTVTAADQTYSGSYTCKGRHKTRSASTADSNALSLTVHVPPVPSLQLQSTWLDVFPSEKVKFGCSVTGSSDWTFTWSRDGKDVQNTDPNASLASDGSALTVTAADQTYSGRYACKGRHKTRSASTADSNPLSLSVYANKPKATVSRNPKFDKMFPEERVSFTCAVGVSSGWEYLWYHDGKEVQTANSETYNIDSIDHPDNGQYRCKAKRGKDPFYTEESETASLQVSDPPKPSLRLATSWADVFENETVGFRCEIGNSDWTFTWHKNQQQPLSEDEILVMDQSEGSFNITSVTKSHLGGYACKAHRRLRKISSGFSNTVDVTVYDNVPTPSLSKNPGLNPMYVGETVNFTCKVDVSSGWEYRWYKDGRTLTKTGKTISIHLSTSDRGKYSCRATRGDTTLTHKSQEVQQDVIEIPVPSLKAVTPWLDVFPDESVKLSCEMSGSPSWIYTWYKDGQKVQANGVSFDPNGATLSINSASATYAGQYKCSGHLNGRSVHSSVSSELTLTVYDKKPSVTLTQDPDYRVMFSGEWVSFSCHINVSSGWEYLWYKDGHSNPESRNNHTINRIEATDKGSYKCQARRGSTQAFTTAMSQAISLEVEVNKPKPLMTQQPDDVMVYTGEPVSFECKVELSSGWQYVWYKDGAQVLVNSSSFKISDANSSSSGSYKCLATRSKTNYNTSFSDERILHISAIPVPLLINQTPWLDVFPTESVTLSCDMDRSSNWRYTWYKDEKQIKVADAVSFDSDRATLTISSASASRRGRYSCSATLKTRPVNSNFSSGLTLSVYDRKPTVTLIQSPEYNVMHTGDSVSFDCHINVSSGWEYLWYKADSPITESGNNHTITSVLTHHSGKYKCQTKRKGNTDFLSDQSQSINLDIHERPQAHIVLLTGWSEVFSTDSLVLKCGVQNSEDKWNYTWFKADQEIEMVLSEKHTVTPQNDPDQSLYQCKGIRNGRPSYSKTSDHFKTKNLLLKRRVLLSISGCIVFGIAAVFIGCIVLRVFRKPAKDEYKPEEADLFVSMAQLKDRDDAPCPLVQYITDAALKSSAKEEEENGTICSETTPLPITSQEDQAAATESGDAKEENGGLVSFKQ